MIFGLVLRVSHILNLLYLLTDTRFRECLVENTNLVVVTQDVSNIAV